MGIGNIVTVFAQPLVKSMCLMTFDKIGLRTQQSFIVLHPELVEGLVHCIEIQALFFSSYSADSMKSLFLVLFCAIVCNFTYNPLPSLFAQAKSAPLPADLIVHNARVYTVDSAFSVAEAFAVRSGKFLAVGASKDILSCYKARQVVNLNGKPVYPGFYDAHAHLYNYGRTLQQADLNGATSYNEVLARLVAWRKRNPKARWILGRGWDQNDWSVQQFPSKEPLDSLFPSVPVCLTRVDGHALVANSAALRLAKIDAATASTAFSGGLVETRNGQPTGILIDNAMERVYLKIPLPTEPEVEQAILAAQTRCFAVGLTSLAEAGITRQLTDTYERLHKQGRCQMRVYAMLIPTEENVDYLVKRGPYATDFLTVRSFKVLADGALGSRGACLLTPYSDKPTTRGFLTIDPQQMERLVERVSKTALQINTHCIGDSANRFILDLYGKYLGDNPANISTKRWRIEHAQIVAREDMEKFRRYGIIPSVQPTHCTSDMPWAGDRLGAERMKTAYTFKELYEQNKTLALGSDFPVEDINPLYGFHAAVARQDADGKPAGGFQMENALRRELALRGMTAWAAYAGFEEGKKGSIEAGKLADFVVLEEDIMQVPAERLRSVRVAETFVGGKRVHKRAAR
jgi:predicted amidohydrolase YtcJ